MDLNCLNNTTNGIMIVKKDDCWQDGVKGKNKGREVIVLSSLELQGVGDTTTA
jgi:hypothetical protein